MEVDGSAILRGAAEPRDQAVLRLASFAGLHKAELAVSVADGSLAPLKQAPSKQFDDLKAQLRMLLADRVQERKRLASEIKAQLFGQLAGRGTPEVRMRVTCTTRHQVPCVIWQATSPVS